MMPNYDQYTTSDYVGMTDGNTSYGYDLYDLNSSYAYNSYDEARNFTQYTNLHEGHRNLSLLEDANRFILPWWRQLIWSILFGGMVIVATGGNLIVVWIVLAHKRMRTVTNYFIVNLSVADAMVATLNVTFNYTFMLNSHWPFGMLYCKISQFVAVLSISASVFTLMAIAIDRYMAIMSPLRPRMGKRSTLGFVAAIWILSLALSFPMIVFSTTDIELLKDDQIRVVCYLEWPDGPQYQSLHEYIYNVIFMFLTYFLPIGAMTFTYARVGVELWGSQSIGECTQRQLDNIKSKRRVVKMMMVVVLIFAVCWLPYHLYFIVSSYYPDIGNLPYIQEMFLSIYWLAMSNSMYNPIIYCWMNHRFRRGFKQFFRWCPFVHLSPETLQRREAVTSRYSCSGSPDHHRIIRNDTERSFLYSTCPGSPTHHRMSRGGSVRIPMHLTTTTLGGGGGTQLNTFNNDFMLNRSNTTTTALAHKWTSRPPAS